MGEEDFPIISPGKGIYEQSHGKQAEVPQYLADKHSTGHLFPSQALNTIPRTPLNLLSRNKARAMTGAQPSLARSFRVASRSTTEVSICLAGMSQYVRRRCVFSCVETSLKPCFW